MNSNFVPIEEEKKNGVQDAQLMRDRFAVGRPGPFLIYDFINKDFNLKTIHKSLVFNNEEDFDYFKERFFDYEHFRDIWESDFSGEGSLFFKVGQSSRKVVDILGADADPRHFIMWAITYVAEAINHKNMKCLVEETQKLATMIAAVRRYSEEVADLLQAVFDYYPKYHNCKENHTFGHLIGGQPVPRHRNKLHNWALHMQYLQQWIFYFIFFPPVEAFYAAVTAVQQCPPIRVFRRDCKFPFMVNINDQISLVSPSYDELSSRDDIFREALLNQDESQANLILDQKEQQEQEQEQQQQIAFGGLTGAQLFEQWVRSQADDLRNNKFGPYGDRR